MIWFCPQAIWSQDITPNLSKKEVLEAYSNAYHPTLLYVQTDKTFYKPSDKIWYKGFLIDATTFRPLFIGEPTIVELLDPQGNVVHSSYHLPIGTFSSNVLINNAWPGGIYTLRAYTQNMKKLYDVETASKAEHKDENTKTGSDGYIFTKKITVQKVITPRILLKVDFLRRAYGKGDKVEALLKVTDLNNQQVSDAVVKATIRLDGKAYQTFNTSTKDGEVTIAFTLPDTLTSIDGIMQLVVEDKGVQESITRSIPIVLNNISLQLYPEGGDIIEGSKSTVAFEALDEFGKGADITGELLDKNGKVLQQFSSYHLGMGAFSFTPSPNEKYSVRIINPVGNSTPIALPKSKKGYGLSLVDKDENITNWNVYASNANRKMTLVAHSHGVWQAEKNLSLKKGDNFVKIDTKNSPMGIAVFTLFDEADKPIAERLVFVHSDKRMQIEILPDKEIYKPGERARVTIQTKDSEGRTCQANVGLAVVDEQLLTMADDKQNTLMTYMFLSSELKGEIQEPSFYFDPEEEKASGALDYLLLTHGWRRFNWTNILTKTNSAIHMPQYILDTAIYGFVLDPYGNPVAGAEVFLQERANKQRMSNVKTNKDGLFMFTNVDITSDNYVITALPNYVYVQDKMPMAAIKYQTDKEKDAYNKSLEKNKDSANSENVQSQETQVANIGDQEALPSIPQPRESKPSLVPLRDEVLDENLSDGAFMDNQSLDEVMVVGYGVSKKSSLVGSVTIVRDDNSRLSLTSALHGQLSGLSVTANNPVNQTFMQYGAQSSLTNANMLLMYNDQEYNDFDVLDLVSPIYDGSGSIYSNQNSPTFGAKAMNGTVALFNNTRALARKSKKPSQVYQSVLVLHKEVYTPKVRFTKAYDDNNPTVYWNGDVQTDINGRATVSFENNRNVSTFRITAEGVSSAGQLATQTKRIVTQKPFSIDAKIPMFVGTNDLVKIPLMLKNITDEEMIVGVNIESAHLRILNPTDSLKNIRISPRSTTTVYIEAKADSYTGDANIYIAATSASKTEHLKQTLTIRDINFPHQFDFSGDKLSDETIFYYPGNDKVINFKAKCDLYFSIQKELTEGVNSIIREPYGCFEQVLSSAMPNIFAYQLLKQTSNKTDSKIINVLESGYNKLANYEVKKTGGFEWYGGTPAHEMLTAYGLIYFYEMDKISKIVDHNKVKRAEEFLMSRKNNKGGFHQNAGKYGFSGALPQVNNAFIVYAMHYIGKGNLVDEEYLATKKEALASKDFYRMALLANVAYTRGDSEPYHQFVDLLKDVSDFGHAKMEGTVVRSYGTGQVEAVSYWLLALLKSDQSDRFLIEKCVSYIRAGKRGGGFGNTQATSVALQALSEYSKKNKETIKGSFKITINDQDQVVELASLTKNSEIEIDEKLFRKGANKIKLSTLGAEKAIPYSVAMRWYSSTPESSKVCPLVLTTSMPTRQMKVNETVRLSIQLQNKEQSAKPMSVAVIGIPGGMSLQAWQLKELLDQNIVDFYEIIDDNLVIYYRELGPSEEKNINLDLKAEIPGTYTGQASSAYVYYMSEHKYWTPGIVMDIQEVK